MTSQLKAFPTTRIDRSFLEILRMINPAANCSISCDGMSTWRTVPREDLFAVLPTAFSELYAEDLEDRMDLALTANSATYVAECVVMEEERLLEHGKYNAAMELATRVIQWATIRSYTTMIAVATCFAGLIAYRAVQDDYAVHDMTTKAKEYLTTARILAAPLGLTIIPELHLSAELGIASMAYRGNKEMNEVQLFDISLDPKFKPGAFKDLVIEDHPTD